jgi:hypothetical protein
MELPPRHNRTLFGPTLDADKIHEEMRGSRPDLRGGKLRFHRRKNRLLAVDALEREGTQIAKLMFRQAALEGIG